jgi:hypothetical protein
MPTPERREATHPVGTRRRRRRRFVSLVVLVALAAGAAVFEPWKLFTDVEVDDPDPFAAPAAPESRAPADVVGGGFTGIAHATTGRATLGPAADGSTVLFFDDLRTDSGPTLRVYLSRTRADGDARGFGVDALDLGDLKGNLGDQVYAVPAATDVTPYRSVVIWCERFGVAFAAAPLAPA